VLSKPKYELNQNSLIGSSGLKFSKIQKFASAFLIIALVALSAKVFQLTTKPEATLRSIADSDDATGNAFFTQRETLVLAINFERWLSGNETKRAVLIRRSLLGQRLNVKDSAGVTNAERASSGYLKALQEIDNCLAEEGEGVLLEPRQTYVRTACGDSLEVLTFEARQLGIEISNSGDIRLRDIIRRERDDRDTQLIQLLLVVASLLLVGGLLGISRVRALQGVRRVIEDDERKLKDTRNSLANLESQVEERIKSDRIQRTEDQRLDTELRSTHTELRDAATSVIAIEALANGLYRLIDSDLIYVLFFAGAEERDLAYMIRGDDATMIEFEQLGIDREFRLAMLTMSQKILNENGGGSVSMTEISNEISQKFLIDFEKLGLNDTSMFVPISEGQIVLGCVVFQKRYQAALLPNQYAAVQSAVAYAANSIGAIRSLSLVQKVRENEQVMSELRALDRLKDEFAANVNHELRTPLTSIIGYLELVLSDSQLLPETTLSYLTTVRRNADRLLELIERLLVVAKTDDLDTSFRHAEVDLAEIVRDAVQVVSQKDLSKSIDIKVEIEQVGFYMNGDQLRLEQIVINLVSNAVKFSKGGSTVFVTLRRLPSEPGGASEAELTIKDSGIGIPANEISDLFKRFFRASNASKALIPGTGLGLSIAKKFVEDHKGKISIDSVVGHGATVLVRLPLS